MVYNMLSPVCLRILRTTFGCRNKKTKGNCNHFCLLRRVVNFTSVGRSLCCPQINLFVVPIHFQRLVSEDSRWKTYHFFSSSSLPSALWWPLSFNRITDHRLQAQNWVGDCGGHCGCLPKCILSSYVPGPLIPLEGAVCQLKIRFPSLPSGEECPREYLLANWVKKIAIV